MDRGARSGDVPENGRDPEAVQHVAGDVGEDLKAVETELPNAAVHLCHRSLTIAKTDCAQPGEPAWISGNDPGKIVIDACGPIARFRSAKHVGSERNAVA